MRAVMPRILRNGEGQPVKEAAMPEAPERRSLEEGNDRAGQGKCAGSGPDLADLAGSSRTHRDVLEVSPKML